MTQSDELIAAKMKFDRTEYTRCLRQLEAVFEGLTESEIGLLHEAGEIQFGICFDMRGMQQRKWAKVRK